MKLKQRIIEIGAVVILLMMIIAIVSQLNYESEDDNTSDGGSGSLSLMGAMSGTIG